jgi:membrane-bound serine protease (ClpP class)
MLESSKVRLSAALMVLPIVSLLIFVAQVDGQNAGRVLMVEVRGFVGPATVFHVEEAVDVAKTDRSVKAVIIALDTFGGSADSTFRIVELMQSSPAPIIGYVYPAGRQALSAGTFILMASDLAAMAPFSTIGSAQPVIGTEPTGESKFLNAFAEKMVSYAEIHGRNTTQASRFIINNDNLQADRAKLVGVIEVISESPEELLKMVHGMTVKTLLGTVTLDTADATLVREGESLRVQTLKILSDPLIANLLISIGPLALILGLASPGYGSEVAGAIMIVLGLIGLGFNVDILALALIAFGAGLLVAEVHTPGFGVMGVSGILILALGLALNISRPFEPVPISPAYVQETLTIALVSLSGVGSLFAIIIYKGLKATRMQKILVKSQDPKALLGSTGVVRKEVKPGEPGVVLVASDLWSATADETISENAKIKVIGSEGLKLKVAKLE